MAVRSASPQASTFAYGYHHRADRALPVPSAQPAHFAGCPSANFTPRTRRTSMAPRRNPGRTMAPRSLLRAASSLSGNADRRWTWQVSGIYMGRAQATETAPSAPGITAIMVKETRPRYRPGSHDRSSLSRERIIPGRGRLFFVQRINLICGRGNRSA
jgi:hypothetical protein